MDRGAMTDKQRLILDVACNILEVLFNLFLKFTPFGGELRIRPFATDGRYVSFGKPGGSEPIDSRIQKIDAARRVD